MLATHCWETAYKPLAYLRILVPRYFAALWKQSRKMTLFFPCAKTWLFLKYDTSWQLHRHLQIMQIFLFLNKNISITLKRFNEVTFIQIKHSLKWEILWWHIGLNPQEVKSQPISLKKHGVISISCLAFNIRAEKIPTVSVNLISTISGQKLDECVCLTGRENTPYCTLQSLQWSIIYSPDKLTCTLNCGSAPSRPMTKSSCFGCYK